MKVKAEYIWIDGTPNTPKLRSKTKVLDLDRPVYVDIVDDNLAPELFNIIPEWGFDGSSTNQASGFASDCILKPIRAINNPLQSNAILILCEVLIHDPLNPELIPHPTNTRRKSFGAHKKFSSQEPLFGIEQEYTLMKNGRVLGWPEGGFPPPQGPFYCGVGADEVFGRDIVNRHLDACLEAKIPISGVNAEVMPGQWEFQVGPASTLEVSDYLWLARFLLYRVAELYDTVVTLHPKPVRGDWNGAGAHTNFSTKSMRDGTGAISGFQACVFAVEDLANDFKENGFPEEYGHNYQLRLTGEHETCSYREFKWGVGDRTASVRIPLHVKLNDGGYIEDRRPCANIDPYLVTSKLIQIVCGSNH